MSAQPDTELAELARTKLSRVLGPARSDEEFRHALAQLGLKTISTVSELYLFAEQLQKREGFVATVGALLAVEAARRQLLTPRVRGM
jgi:hypothetical protein